MEMQWCCWTAFNAQDSPTQQRITQPKMSLVMGWDSKFPGDSINTTDLRDGKRVDWWVLKRGYTHTRLGGCRVVWHFNHGTSSHHPVSPVCRTGFLLPSSVRLSSWRASWEPQQVEGPQKTLKVKAGLRSQPPAIVKDSKVLHCF